MKPKLPVGAQGPSQTKPVVSSPEMRALWNKATEKLADKQPDVTDMPLFKAASSAFAWSPEDSQSGLGSILLKQQPQDSLTPQAYRFALQSRLEALIVAAGPDAQWLLKVVEENEPGLSLYGTPEQIAEMLVENSSWLRERTGMPRHPVSAPLSIDRDALAYLQSDDDSLEAYLNALYYDGGGD